MIKLRGDDPSYYIVLHCSWPTKAVVSSLYFRCMPRTLACMVPKQLPAFFKVVSRSSRATLKNLEWPGDVADVEEPHIVA